MLKGKVLKATRYTARMTHTKVGIFVEVPGPAA
jgi:hypothetical protein